VFGREPGIPDLVGRRTYMAWPDSTDATHSSRSAGSGETAHDRAVTLIRNAILQGVLSPGHWLIEADLASQFGLSRGSVRSALIEIAGEGFVERLQYRGARVRAVDREGAIRITEVRVVVEGLLAAKAAINATDEELEEVAAMGPAMLEAVSSGDVSAYSRLNTALHRRIAEAARHEEALAVVGRLRGLSGVTHQFRLATLPGRASTSIHEHLALIDAVTARDHERAEHVMRSHLLSVVQALRGAPVPLHAVPEPAVPTAVDGGGPESGDFRT
jgi:DNA-binding GntR family transcriptional regulator